MIVVQFNNRNASTIDNKFYLIIIWWFNNYQNAEYDMSFTFWLFILFIWIICISYWCIHDKRTSGICQSTSNATMDFLQAKNDGFVLLLGKSVKQYFFSEVNIVLGVTKL